MGMVDLPPDTWNQFIEVLQDWAIILKNRTNSKSTLENRKEAVHV